MQELEEEQFYFKNCVIKSDKGNYWKESTESKKLWDEFYKTIEYINNNSLLPYK